MLNMGGVSELVGLWVGGVPWRHGEATRRSPEEAKAKPTGETRRALTPYREGPCPANQRAMREQWRRRVNPRCTHGLASMPA